MSHLPFFCNEWNNNGLVEDDVPVVVSLPTYAYYSDKNIDEINYRLLMIDFEDSVDLATS